MRREITVVGVIILLFGLVLAVAGTRTTYQTVEHTETVIETTDYSLPAYYYVYWYKTLDAGDKVSGSIQTTQPVNFYIFTNDQFNDWQTAYSYSPSAPSIVTRTSSQSMAFSVTIQSTGTYYLVVDNYYGYSGCVISSIKVDRIYYETVERKDYTLNMVGGFLTIVGLVVAIVGATRKVVEKEVPTPPVPVAPTPVEPAPEPIPEPTPEFCPSCGSKIPPDTTFCPHCGAAI